MGWCPNFKTPDGSWCLHKYFIFSRPLSMHDFVDEIFPVISVWTALWRNYANLPVGWYSKKALQTLGKRLNCRHSYLHDIEYRCEAKHKGLRPSVPRGSVLFIQDGALKKIWLSWEYRSCESIFSPGYRATFCEKISFTTTPHPRRTAGENKNKERSLWVLRTYPAKNLYERSLLNLSLSNF